MEAFGALLWLVLLAFACFFVGVGFLVGYFVGRRARESQRGFQVLVPDSSRRA